MCAAGVPSGMCPVKSVGCERAEASATRQRAFADDLRSAGSSPGAGRPASRQPEVIEGEVIEGEFEPLDKK